MLIEAWKKKQQNHKQVNKNKSAIKCRLEKEKEPKQKRCTPKKNNIQILKKKNLVKPGSTNSRRIFNQSNTSRILRTNRNFDSENIFKSYQKQIFVDVIVGSLNCALSATGFVCFFEIMFGFVCGNGFSFGNYV